MSAIRHIATRVCAATSLFARSAARHAILIAFMLTTIAPSTHALAEPVTRRVHIEVQVLDHDGNAIWGLPIIADRQSIDRNSQRPCGWTDSNGRVILEVLVQDANRAVEHKAINDVRATPGNAVVPIRIASVAPGCGVSDSPEDQKASADWTHRLDTLMKTSAFPDHVDAIVPLAPHVAPRDSFGESNSSDAADDITSLEIVMRASRALRVVAKVKHLRDRVLFCTPERVDAFNPMWQLFRLAERVPTDDVVMDGVPVCDPADASHAPHKPTRLRIVSSGKVVSRIIDVPIEERSSADLDGVAGEQVDLGTLVLPQDIAKYPIDESVQVLGKDGSLRPLEAGRAISLTLCAVDGTHLGLLWHIDVMGGARGGPKPGNLDQRAHMPEGLFAVLPTKSLDSPLAFSQFLDAAQSNDWQSHEFPLLRVEAGKASLLEFNEQTATDAANQLLESIDPLLHDK